MLAFFLYRYYYLKHEYIFINMMNYSRRRKNVLFRETERH